MALIFLLIGVAVGGVLAVGFGAGMGAAGGLLMGAQTGVCLAAEAARGQGGLDEAGADALISTAMNKIRAKSESIPMQSGVEWVKDSAGCARLLEQFSKGMERKPG
ncbi:hypothetical protein [Thiocystis violacea]|uniref:hypothetical protein n=1 Tax=Thiocystis violacea TaxID=13725 RepID=UPI001F5B6EC5|nr:hypothetical protein [Thiocystis violacea]